MSQKQYDVRHLHGRFVQIRRNKKWTDHGFVVVGSTVEEGKTKLILDGPAGLFEHPLHECRLWAA